MATTRDSQQSKTAPPLTLRGSLNVPNTITLTRLALSFVLFWMIYVDALWLTAAALFVFAVATDAIDGYIARRYGLVTILGRILDPFVDKIIVCGAFLFLLEKGSAATGINAWFVVIVIGREMLVTSLRGFLEQQGHDFSASAIGKLKMLLQSVAVTASLLSLSPQFDSATFALLRDGVIWAAVAVTLYSGYIYVWRAIAMLGARPG